MDPGPIRFVARCRITATPFVARVKVAHEGRL